MNKTVTIIAIGVIVGAYVFFTGGGFLVASNPNPADYIKDAVVYQEGDGIIVYFILADANGEMIKADGRVSLKIKDSNDQEVYSTAEYVTKEMFYKTKRGRGAFEQDVLLFNFGRIKLDSLLAKPKGVLDVSVSFTTEDGRILKGEDSTYI